jgi:transcriptional regulator with XRE-family HTH domain
MGHTLRELRTAKGWSQETLARMVGVSQTTIWYVERGQRRPGASTRERIALLLGVTPATIAWPAGQANANEAKQADAAQAS